MTGPANRLLSDGIYRYEYDSEGNRTARFVDVNQDSVLDAGDTDVTAYSWDNRNRLIEVTDYTAYGGDATQIVDYLYDVENRWIGESIDSNGDGTVDRQICFAYDGNQIVLQFDRVLSPLPLGEGQDEGGAMGVADLSHRYLWQPDVVDQLIADERTHLENDEIVSDEVLWALTDHLGTVRDLAVYDAETGTTTVANHRVYDAFGNLTNQTNSAVDCLFAFTGRPYDKATSLQNNLYRWYDDKVGRWVSEDPVGFNGSDTHTSRYCENGPTNATDPTGLASATWKTGGKWILTNLKISDIVSWGEMIRNKIPGYSWYNPVGIFANSIPVAYLDAGWWLSFKISGTAELSGTIAVPGKQDINVDIKIDFCFDINYKVTNRASTLATLGGTAFVRWFMSYVRVLKAFLSYEKLMMWMEKANKATGDLGKLYKIIDGKWGSLSVSPSALLRFAPGNIVVRGSVSGGPFYGGWGGIAGNESEIFGLNKKNFPGPYHISDIEGP